MLQSKQRLNAVNGFFSFLHHAVEKNLDRNNVMHEPHTHTGAEDRGVDIAGLESGGGFVTGNDGDELLYLLRQ